jgi:hypothetical protein
MTRREALQRGLFAAAGLALGSRRVLAASTPPAAVPGGLPAKARSVIQIWMWGGPCHLDTFDPKPGAGNDYCGPLTAPIATNVDGLRIGQLLPRLARHADKYSIVRSMTHGVNAHETASYLVQTGHQPGQGLVHPCVGAVVSVFKGYEHGYQGLVPPYIVLTTAQGRFSEAGFLGNRHAPFATGGNPNGKPFAVEGIVLEGVSEERQLKRRQFLQDLDLMGKAMAADPRFREFDESGAKAHRTMAQAGKLFDLSLEKDELRDRYGRNTFGQSCLVARRLVEHGVPYITINYPGWDTHKQHFQLMNRQLPEMDQGMATLLEDLTERGLLDSTIVWWGGEFGRTPRVQWEPPWNGGRGHYGQCFSVVVAGGGFKGGRVVGASDEKGEEVAARPVHPEDLLGSIYTLLGIDRDGWLPNDAGVKTRVMPSSESGPGRGRLTELM